MLVLSLFPGADLLGMAFEREGFCVVQGPDILLGGDIKDFHALPSKFDGVIGGPPCQLFSQAYALSKGKGKAVNLIPEFERVVREAAPKWWLMENVPGAPIPNLSDTKWNEILNAWDFGSKQNRKRRFSSNLFLCPVKKAHVGEPLPTVMATEYKAAKVQETEKSLVRRKGLARKLGRRPTIQEVNIAMGLPPNFTTPLLTVKHQYIVRGNGVPIEMGRAIARAIKEAVKELDNTTALNITGEYIRITDKVMPEYWLQQVRKDRGIEE